MALVAAPADSFAAAQQQRTISGTVVDEAGGPIVGASVIVTGTTRGSITNVDGTFSLQVNEGDVLEISYIGYVKGAVVVDSRSDYRVVMQQDTQQLDEVVVIGYGTARKRDVAGAIAVMSNKDLDIGSVTNVQNLFQGRLAGVSVSSSGVPGEAPSVRVRGVGTLSDNTPLYVIDGIPTKSEIATQINPASIENVQVLRDAASASIYGAQAANGVILITTKQGRAGKAQINVSMNTGVQMATYLPEMLSPQQYGEVLWDAMKNAGLTPQHAQYGNGAAPVIPDYILPDGAMEGSVDLSNYNTLGNQYMRANKAGTDWQQEVYRPAQTFNFGITAQGGNEDSKYFASANYESRDAVLKWSGYDRISVMANSVFTIAKGVNFGLNMNASQSQYTGSTNNEDAAKSPAIIPVRDVMGNWAGTKANGLGDRINPVAAIYNNRHNVTERQNFLGSAFLEIKFVDNLVFKSTAGANTENRNHKRFSPVTYWNKGDKNTLVNTLTQNETRVRELTWSNTLTYSNTFAGSHTLNVLVGTEARDNKSEEWEASRKGFASEDPDYWYLDAGEDVASKDNSGEGSAYSFFSLFGRVDYNYRNRYYLQGVVRRDGSSRFGANNKYGVFPSVSAAWRISEEGFMAGQGIFDDLKLRVSYGVTGNSDIGNYAYASTYASVMTSMSYPITGDVGSVSPGLAMTARGNANLKWETITQANIGLDAAFLNNRLTFSVDVYDKRTRDILQRPTYPGTAGTADAPYENIGSMQNRGWEFSANYRNSGQSDFGYDVGVILSGYRNKVTTLYGGTALNNAPNRTEVGRPRSFFYGFMIDGIFQNQAEVDAHATQTDKAVGRWRFRDYDGNGTINDSDRMMIGSPHPDFEYSLNGSLYYKNFDLRVFVQGSYGNDILFASKYGQEGIDFWNDYFNKSTRILDSWSEDNRDAQLPEVNILNPNGEGTKVTSYLVEDGSYLRLKMLEIGYTLPSSLLSKVKISNARVYVSGENLFTLTKYSNADPEVRNDGNHNNMGVDYLTTGLPVARVFSVGLSVSF
ncbi:MAG: TonB-dependent receptor [Alistipes sp.]|nr:TonB-dependent receptor [Alistipes sp.]